MGIRWGDAEFAHSCVDKYAIVSIASHEGNYPSRYVVVPLIVDGTLHTGTQFPICMDCGLMMDGEDQNQRTGLYLGLKMGVKLFVRELKLEL